MQVRIIDLQSRDVINIATGMRLGGVYDAIVDADSGAVTAIVIPGKYRFFGIFGRTDDYIIPWNAIRKIGDDIILCEVMGEYRREKSVRRRWL